MRTKLAMFLIFTFLFYSCGPTLSTIGSDSPCNDPRLIKYEQSDSLSGNDLELYIALKQMCQEQKNSVAIENELKEISFIQGYFYYVSIFSIILAVIVVLANSK